MPRPKPYEDLLAPWNEFPEEEYTGVPLTPRSWQSICICNQTLFTLVYVISHREPLFWGLLQPGEFVERKTGPFLFRVKTYPWDGSNEPRRRRVILQHLATVAEIGAAGMMVSAIVAAGGLMTVGGLMVLTGAFGIVRRRATIKLKEGVKKKMDSIGKGNVNEVTKWVKARGEWIYVIGGPSAVTEDCRLIPNSGRPMKFSRYPLGLYEREALAEKLLKMKAAQKEEEEKAAAAAKATTAATPPLDSVLLVRIPSGARSH